MFINKVYHFLLLVLLIRMYMLSKWIDVLFFKVISINFVFHDGPTESFKQIFYCSSNIADWNDFGSVQVGINISWEDVYFYNDLMKTFISYQIILVLKHFIKLMPVTPAWHWNTVDPHYFKHSRVSKRIVWNSQTFM